MIAQDIWIYNAAIRFTLWPSFRGGRSICILRPRRPCGRISQYHSDSLPEGNLEIRVDQNRFQEAVGTLRSPYLILYLIFLVPILLVIAAVIVAVVLLVRRKRRSGR